LMLALEKAIQLFTIRFDTMRSAYHTRDAASNGECNVERRGAGRQRSFARVRSSHLALVWAPIGATP
jgi:hypothetical protein